MRCSDKKDEKQNSRRQRIPLDGMGWDGQGNLGTFEHGAAAAAAAAAQNQPAL